MKKLHLAFLWHMHQPYYKDEGSYKMPWVFLHAIKDYYDMPRYCELFGVKATFNLVPSLMAQLENYADPFVADDLLRAMRKNPQTLALQEIEELVPKLFMAQPAQMITPFSGYRKLYDRYVKNKDPLQFTAAEICDLCVYYLLAWTGMQTRKELDFAAKMLAKGGGYNEDEKQRLLDELQAHVGRILAYYKNLQNQGKIEISVTPFYHPILPLLINLNAAKDALPDVAMPNVPENFAGFGKDAQWHVSAAVEYYRQKFGCAPRGMWPAEGGVSTKALALMYQNGLHWAASDEDVLGGTLVKDLKLPGNRGYIYQKYMVNTPAGELGLFFRDKKLSDLIGFTYANMPARAAAGDFVERLRQIYNDAENDVVVPVILDGENAWEFYDQGAYPFFAELYKKLGELNWLVTRTMGDIMRDESLPAGHLESGVRAGSWIYGTFSTWLGHAEKNRAWELLTRAEIDISAVEDKLEPEKQARTRKFLHIAQGSDWFWWYGDDHFTTQAAEYDGLFRANIINAYQSAGLEAPEDLYTPIKTGGKAGLVRASTNFIIPVIDGKITSFFEWMGSGMFDITYDMGAMHSDERILSLFQWGFGRDYLYLRLNGDFKPRLNQNYAVEIKIELDKTYKVRVELSDGFAVSGDLSGVEAAADDILELLIPKKALNLDAFETMRLVFKVLQNNKLVERAPAYNPVEIETDLSSTFIWMT